MSEKRATRRGPLRRALKAASRALALRAVPVLAFALYLLSRTWRVTIVDYGFIAAEHAAGRTVIYAIGHGRMLAPLWVMRGRGVRVLISEHFDGELITRVIECFGFGAARGSATRGGARALRELVREAKQHDLAVTPDGPRGPFLSVKPGLPYLAARTGCTVFAATFDADRRIEARSWDRFRLPLPGARVVIVVAPPRPVAGEATEVELEAERRAIEADLVRIDAEATRLARESARGGAPALSMVSQRANDWLIPPGGKICEPRQRRARGS